MHYCTHLCTFPPKIVITFPYWYNQIFLCEELDTYIDIKNFCFFRKIKKKDKQQARKLSTISKTGATSTVATKSHSAKSSSISDEGVLKDEEQVIISCSRDLLLMIQNDKSQSYAMTKGMNRVYAKKSKFE